MDEEKDKHEEEGGKPADSQPSEEEKSSPSDVVQAANAAAERLEKANEKMEQLIRQQEATIVAGKLGGNTQAGMVPKNESREQKLDREAAELMKNAGYELEEKDLSKVQKAA